MTKSEFRILLLTISVSISLLPLKAQQAKTANFLPRVENYSKGALDLMVAPFGLGGNEINVGKILADGVIHFDWPKIDVSTIETSEFFMEPIDRAVGMSFCNDKKIEQNDETVKAVDSKHIFLYKEGMQVGSLYPATKKEMEDNGSLNRRTSLVLGSELSWVYSDGDATFKAKCIVNTEWENSYDFLEVTTFNIHLKKGWNMVEYTLLEKEDWKKDTAQGSLPKTISKKTITQIPESINWYVK